MRPGGTDGADRPRRELTSCLANAIEWYDFAVYGAMASVLRRGAASTRLRQQRAGRGVRRVRDVVPGPTGRRSPRRAARRPVRATPCPRRDGPADERGDRRHRPAPDRGRRRRSARLRSAWSLLRLVQGFASGGEISTVDHLPAGVGAARPLGSLRRVAHGHGRARASPPGIAVAGTGRPPSCPTTPLEQLGVAAAVPARPAPRLVGLYVRLRLDETPAFAARATEGPSRRGSLARPRTDGPHRLRAGRGPRRYLQHVVRVPAGAPGSRRRRTAVGRRWAARQSGSWPRPRSPLPLLGALSDRVGRRPRAGRRDRRPCACSSCPSSRAATNGSTALLLRWPTSWSAWPWAPWWSAPTSRSGFPVSVRATGIALTCGLGDRARRRHGAPGGQRPASSRRRHRRPAVRGRAGRGGAGRECSGRPASDQHLDCPSPAGVAEVPARVMPWGWRSTTVRTPCPPSRTAVMNRPTSASPFPQCPRPTSTAHA